tara:strand:- start:13322 stop:15184 length:1863 start_codon:yes stop_codon:yes gene_type:complete
LIKLDDIKGRSAINILQTYEGINPYIKKMALTLLQNGKISLTASQTKYVIDNHKREPELINKVIEISEYLGLELQKSNDLPFVPKRIKFEYILGDNDKTYHVYGKLTQKQKHSGMYFIPKTQVMDDPYFEEIHVDVDFEKYEALDTFELDDGTIGRTFYEHQKKGIKFLLTRDGCMIADDMGLGKTLQSIVAALESGAKKILVVCPASVKINWEREINNFQCYDTNIIDSREWKTAKFTIINYDILKNFHALPTKTLKKEYIRKSEQPLLASNFDLCIIDEAHKLKNKDSKRGAIMAEVCKDIPKVWLLTGTPVANRPMDFYNLLKLIKAPITKNWLFYVKRYCDGRRITTTDKRTKQPRTIWLTNGASNLIELANKTRNTYIRRLKSQISDMPDKIITPLIHKLDANQREEYEYLWEEYMLERAEKKKRGEPDRALVELGLLRKYVAMQAIPETIKMAEDIIEQGHKVIIFTSFTDELLDLSEHFGNKCVIHYGGMNNKEKQASVDKFQKTKRAKVFIGNIISAGVGITLTEGTYVIFNSFDWVPGNNVQAEDRPYRIGQKNNVNVYYQLFENTVSTRMWNTVHKKKEIIATIMGESNVTEEGALGIIIDNIIENEEES